MIPLLVIGILEQFYLIEIEYIEIKIEITGTSLLGAPRRSCFCSSRSSCSSCSCSPTALLPLLHLSPSCRSLPTSVPARLLACLLALLLRPSLATHYHV